jgi:hypothetical protein
MEKGVRSVYTTSAIPPVSNKNLLYGILGENEFRKHRIPKCCQGLAGNLILIGDVSFSHYGVKLNNIINNFKS